MISFVAVGLLLSGTALSTPKIMNFHMQLCEVFMSQRDKVLPILILYTHSVPVITDSTTVTCNKAFGKMFG